MIRFKKESQKVLYATERHISVNSKSISVLKKLAKKVPDKTIRLCMHKNIKSPIHEMLILLPKNYNVKPHMHPRNSESLTIIQGEADLIFFNKKGKIIKKIVMGNYKSKKVFYYQIPKEEFHTIKVKTSFLIFYEVSKGPFFLNKSKFPRWIKRNNNLSKR